MVPSFQRVSFSRREVIIPWGLIAFLALLFFVIHHNIPGLTNYEFGSSADEIVAATAEGSIRREVGLCVLGLFGLWGILTRNSSRAKNGRALGILLWCYATWALASIVWADNAALTVRRIGVTAMLVLAAVAIARMLSYAQLVHLSVFVSGIFLSIGVITEVVLGTFHPLTPNYRFSGTLAPNHQAWNCGLLLLAATAAAGHSTRWRILFNLVAVVGVGFLILTGSRSSAVAAAIALCGFWYLVWPKRRRLFAIACAVVVAALFLLSLSDSLAPGVAQVVLLGRNDSYTSTLDGRTPVWQECVRYVQKQPITGYGFDSFWTREHVLSISDEAKWGVPGAHNGYLDVILGTGLVGAALYLAVLAVALVRARSLYRQSPVRSNAFCFALLLFFAITMLAEEIAAQATLIKLIVIVILIKLVSSYGASYNRQIHRHKVVASNGRSDSAVTRQPATATSAE